MKYNKILRTNTTGFTQWMGGIEIVPDDYLPTEILPVILFFCGLGESGNGTTDLDKLFNTALPLEIKGGRVLPKRCVVLCIQPDSWFNDTHVSLSIQYALDKYKVNKVSITGLSSGSLGACFGIYNHGDKINNVVICATRPTIGADKTKIKNIPIWICSNDGDEPIERNALIADLTASGALVKTTDKTGASTILPGTSHDSWDKTYAMDEVYEYLLNAPTPTPIVVSDYVDITTQFDTFITSIFGVNESDISKLRGNKKIYVK